jgi:glucokinase
MDVGGTKIAALLVDGDDGVIASGSARTDSRPLGEQVLAAARAVLDGQVPAGVGIATPGQVDAAAGTVRMAVNVSVPEVPLASIVAGELGVPAFVEHDTRAAAAWLLSKGDGDSLTYLSVGTGISAAVAVNGRILRGVSGLAGEIGHVVADPHGPRCVCGLAGCLEAVAAGPAVARQAAAAIDRGERTSLQPGAGPAEVYRAAAEGDRVATRIAAEVGTYLARAVRGIVLAYGVDRVVVGGGLSRAGQPFLSPLLQAIEQERSESALVRHALRQDGLQLLPPNTEAGAWGAVVIARTGLLAASADAGRRREVDDG